jgi:hypothetical protein
MSLSITPTTTLAGPITAGRRRIGDTLAKAIATILLLVPAVRVMAATAGALLHIQAAPRVAVSAAVRVDRRRFRMNRPPTAAEAVGAAATAVVVVTAAEAGVAKNTRSNGNWKARLD